MNETTQLIKKETKLPNDIRTELTKGFKKLYESLEKNKVPEKIEAFHFDDVARQFNDTADPKSLKAAVTKTIDFINSILSLSTGLLPYLDKYTIGTFLAHVLTIVPTKFTKIRSACVLALLTIENFNNMYKLNLDFLQKLNTSPEKTFV